MISKKNNEDYINLKNDVLKYNTIFIVMNILMFLSNISENSLFSTIYIKSIILFNLGLATYWLIIKKYSVIIYECLSTVLSRK